VLADLGHRSERAPPRVVGGPAQTALQADDGVAEAVLSVRCG